MTDDELLATNPMLNGIDMSGLTDLMYNNSTYTITDNDSSTRDDLNIYTDNSCKFLLQVNWDRGVDID